MEKVALKMPKIRGDFETEILLVQVCCHAHCCSVGEDEQGRGMEKCYLRTGCDGVQGDPLVA